MPTILAPLPAGSDAVLSESRFQTSDANALTTSVKKAGVKRLLIVGILTQNWALPHWNHSPVSQPLPARILFRHKPAPSNHIENIATSPDGSSCR